MSEQKDNASPPTERPTEDSSECGAQVLYFLYVNVMPCGHCSWRNAHV